ncbi:hypothetical protein ACFT5B_05410 [Luteimicrobium sp. NPDC057192]|uniref:hypothetical protein n=1 Tax=Luteimicrobium sp. NPDC057192 TaxID=3346042 RepID=UPI0036387DCD
MTGDVADGGHRVSVSSSNRFESPGAIRAAVVGVDVNAHIDGEILTALRPLLSTPPRRNRAADGDLPFAEGDTPFAEGDAPFAEGDVAFAEGDVAFAQGDAAFAEGDAAFADGGAPFAEGDAALGGGA